MTSIYNNFKKLLFDGSIDLANDTIEVALIDDSISYTPDIDGEVYVADVLDGIVASECSGTGYTRQTVNMTTSLDLADDEAVADADDLTYSGADFGTIQNMLVFKSVTDDTDSPLIAHVTSTDFPLTTNGGDVTIQWDAEGVLNLN
ncbi:hypothetical protein [Halapricum desulfuricans]|uniref:Uncharacterized protein n=1 Tax=Halapricum desulfuricans TaxID=2841257 RepID=A0A897N2D9_9EURY|nr:hypothetical protein [Halapricum desulfuricans]QSG06388.1 hypothetical protein HSR121_2056 [Halapricum desulfuricans]